MTRARRIPRVLISVLLASLLALVVSVAGAGAEVEIPTDADIDSATLYVYTTNASGQTVNVHRITAPWVEDEVTWNSFNGNFDSVVIGTFVADSVGWHEVDVTALVIDWINEDYPNYGVLLEQGSTSATKYHSSEYTPTTPDIPADYRPKLEICYNGTCVTIQRPGVEQDGVADAYIWEINPDYNGNWERLYTGLINNYEKQSLLRFDFSVRGGGEGCTPGFWKQEQHFDSWDGTGYSPDTKFSDVDVFDRVIAIRWSQKGKPEPKSDPTLLQALEAKGGGINALARHAVAALLNAANPGTNYFYTEGQIIAMVQKAIDDENYKSTKDLLVEQNEMGCPLNGDSDSPPRDCMECQGQDGNAGPHTVDTSPKKGHGPKPSATNMHGAGPNNGPCNAGGMPAALDEVTPGKGFGKAVSEIAKSGPGAVAPHMGKGKRAH